MGAEQSQLAGEEAKQTIGFFVNGKEYTVKPSVDKVGPNALLVDYIRDHVGLKGTKYMCREGGCGACVVSVKTKDPVTGQDMVRAVNSCLVPVFSADGYEITTVEGLGSQAKGLHPIQQNVVKFGATQCGYCTSGMIMNMYSLSQSKPGFKSQDVEDSFDGNLCRCTGYRPIMDAFKAMSRDASEELKWKSAETPDILCKNCPSTCCKQEIEDSVLCNVSSEVLIEVKSGEIWAKAKTLSNVYAALSRFSQGRMKYRIVGGNTGTGVYKEDGPFFAFIDVNSVPDLKNVTMTTSRVQLGASVTLASAIDLLQRASQLEGYAYTAQISKHLKRVANTPVRNAATLAGNLMLKYTHREFPSDVFMLLEAVGAKLLIGSSLTVKMEHSMLEFLNLNMNGKLILSVIFPPYNGPNYYFKSYKITRRYQNSHAYVNAGIMMRVDPSKMFTVMEKPRIVFGGINPTFTHATMTEDFLQGKRLLDKPTISGSMDTLEGEIQPLDKPPDAAPQYRKALAQAILYKAILSIIGDSAKPMLKSAGQDLEHGPMQGKQEYSSTDETQWPIYKPMPKLEAVVQTTGEAQYINDIPHFDKEIFGAFVHTTVANATLKSVDASEALMTPGVVAFIQAKDIPGLNTYAVFNANIEEIFVSTKVRHAGQSVGMVLADTRDIAFEAVKKVKVSYDNPVKPVLDMKMSIKLAKERGEDNIVQTLKTAQIVETSAKAMQTIKGEFRIGGQYHMYMETMVCICVPNEDGMDVYSATQCMDNVQLAVAVALGVTTNRVNITVRRLGGGYGGKMFKSSLPAAAAAVAAKVTGRPVRVVMDLETNMRMIGKRLPYMNTYEAQVDDSNGMIKGLKAGIYCDVGYVENEVTSPIASRHMQNCYGAPGWEIKSGTATTDICTNTYCRAPGPLQGTACIENIMEHVAHMLKIDPLEFRMRHFIKEGDEVLEGGKFDEENPLPQMILEMKTTADYETRRKFVDNFNMTNRYRKKGLAMTPMRYFQDYPFYSVKYPFYIAVYHADGSIAISHGGIEMGQGINTKVAQVVAKSLNVSMDKIMTKPANTLIAPNAAQTGSAITSELVCIAAVEACKLLLAKMEPAKKGMTKEPTWEELVTASWNMHILTAIQYQYEPQPSLKDYSIWGLCLTEVDVDVLTGEYKIVRVDLVEDAGYSLNPEIDIGQIEGAFVMGLGLWTTEKLIYDQNTGENLTNNTWEYKVPFNKDIPEDFRVTMMKNRPNPKGILRSKATGEPAIAMSVSVLFALRNAINSARKDAGNMDWYQMDGPVTPEDVQRFAMTNARQFDI